MEHKDTLALDMLFMWGEKKKGKKKCLFFLSLVVNFMHNVREFLATKWHNGKELNLEEIKTSLTPGGVGEGRVQGKGKRRGSISSCFISSTSPRLS